MESRALPAAARAGSGPLPWTPILMYHRIVGKAQGPDPRHLAISQRDFVAQMQWLKERGYRSVTLKEIAERARHGLAPSGRTVAITFDDGYLDAFEHAMPVLRALGMTATFFLVSGALGGSNVWEAAQVQRVPLVGRPELEAMRMAGMAFGSHTVTHRPLAGLSPDEAREEINRSREDLERVVGAPMRVFSYPHGRHDPALREMVARAGYVAACGIEQREHSLYSLSRIDATACDGTGLLWRWKVSGVHFRMRQNGALRSAKRLLDRGRTAPRPNGPA